MKLATVMKYVPATPACFPDKLQWAAYLLQCQEYNKRASARPFTEGVGFRPAFDFCRDCLAPHRESMRRSNRCDPEVFRREAAAQQRVIPIAEAACN